MSKDMQLEYRKLLQSYEENEHEIDKTQKVERIWREDEVNDIKLPGNALYDLLSNYSLPFLFYKKVCLNNRNLILKHINVVNNQMEVVMNKLPTGIENIRRFHVDLPTCLLLLLNKMGLIV